MCNRLLAKIGAAPLKISLVRHQQLLELTAKSPPIILLESASSASDFKTLRLPPKSSRPVQANPKTRNDPVSSLVDGALREGYGPVFGNGVQSGAYKLDLGRSENVRAITTWSFDYAGIRGAMTLSLFGSDSVEDPGWDLNNPRFIALGSIDTTGIRADAFNAVSLRAAEGTSLGYFRWIIWRVTPVTGRDENTAFQELAVEVAN